MNVKRLQTLQQIIDFLHSSSAFEPAPAAQAERYQWIEQTLRHFRYASRTKAEKGLLITYLCRISGYSTGARGQACNVASLESEEDAQASLIRGHNICFN